MLSFKSIKSRENSFPSHSNLYFLFDRGGFKEKSIKTAYLYWLFTGICGGHKFYLRRIGGGFFYLLNCGMLIIGITSKIPLLYLLPLVIIGIGLLIDLFTLSRQVKITNQEMEFKRLFQLDILMNKNKGEQNEKI